MKVLTGDSTFQDIRNLLSSKDEYFIRICKDLSNAEIGTENIDAKEYKCRAFYFLMSIVLGGIGDEVDFKKNFINTVFEDKKENERVKEWSRLARNFVDNSLYENVKIDDEYNEKFKKIGNKLQIKYLKDGNWMKDSIFNDSEKWFFKPYDEKDKGKEGKDRAKKEVEQVIDYLLKKYKKLEKTALQCNLLLTNKQLILHGAPGTGKTFSAKNEIANDFFWLSSKIEADKSIQLDMVQFQPSFDYTDFIDGIRPDLSEKTIRYTLKNGLFKTFCRRAGVIERIKANGETIDENNIKKFLKGEDNSIISFWLEWLKNNSNNNYNISELPKFLFVIDEINRAEISKVFGEVMSCLDADYRGEKGKIRTQYSTLATPETFFINEKDDKFFIPSNVYIIGTMNDIDRSVEMFDFALRRRFAWYEVKAEEVMRDILKSMDIETRLDGFYQDYVDRIVMLNKSIASENNTEEYYLNLTDHYHIGPSYFSKIRLYFAENKQKKIEERKKEYIDAIKKVWENHLCQILHEYVKGRGKEGNIKKIGDNFKKV